MKGGSRSLVTMRPFRIPISVPQASPAPTPSAIEPVALMTVAAMQALSPTFAPIERSSAGGENHQRDARRDEKCQAGLAQHVQQVWRRQKGVLRTDSAG